MHKLNLTITEEAFEILSKFKEENNIKNLDEALDKFLLENKSKGEK